MSFPAFLAAINAADDERAERLVADLHVGDQAALLDLLASSVLDQRWWALRALAHIGDQTAVAPIAQRLRADVAEVRAVAALALGELYGRCPTVVADHMADLADCLRDDAGMVRQAAVTALAQCGEAALPVLSSVLRSDQQAARSRAAMALRQIRSPAAVGLLFACLNDANYLVHTYAYETLDEMGLLENLLLAP